MTGTLDPAVVEWLVGSQEPAIRRLARRTLLDQAAPDDEKRILDGQIVRALFDGQRSGGGFGGHPYNKWTGAHWRLISLVELGIPPGEPRALAALEPVLAWLSGSSHRSAVPIINGLARRCGSQEGNALAVACRLGAARDDRVRLLVDGLLEWQWPDGGWNCDRRPEAHRSSFHETLPPIWGLHEYAEASGDADAAAAARRGAELLLGHRVFKTAIRSRTIKPEWLTPHWPPYWHYDTLQALVVLARMGLASDERATDALEELDRRRRADGRWRASRRWWNPPGSRRAPEAADWRIDDSGDRMVTLRALTVLRAATA